MSWLNWAVLGLVGAVGADITFGFTDALQEQRRQAEAAIAAPVDIAELFDPSRDGMAVRVFSARDPLAFGDTNRQSATVQASVAQKATGSMPLPVRAGPARLALHAPPATIKVASLDPSLTSATTGSDAISRTEPQATGPVAVVEPEFWANRLVTSAYDWAFDGWVSEDRAVAVATIMQFDDTSSNVASLEAEPTAFVPMPKPESAASSVASVGSVTTTASDATDIAAATVQDSATVAALAAAAATTARAEALERQTQRFATPRMVRLSHEGVRDFDLGSASVTVTRGETARSAGGDRKARTGDQVAESLGVRRARPADAKRERATAKRRVSSAKRATKARRAKTRPRRWGRRSGLGVRRRARRTVRRYRVYRQRRSRWRQRAFNPYNR